MPEGRGASRESRSWYTQIGLAQDSAICLWLANQASPAALRTSGHTPQTKKPIQKLRWRPKSQMGSHARQEICFTTEEDSLVSGQQHLFSQVVFANVISLNRWLPRAHQSHNHSLPRMAIIFLLTTVLFYPNVSHFNIMLMQTMEWRHLGPSLNHEPAHLM